MGYESPSATELNTAVDHLREKYLNNNLQPNQKRLAMIRFIQDLHGMAQNEKVTKGALALCLKEIEAEKLNSKKITIFGIGVKKGSTLKALLSQALNSTAENPLDDIHRFIYLVELYDYLNRHKDRCEFLVSCFNHQEHTESHLPKAAWKTADSLLNDISNSISQILYQQSDNISTMLRAHLSATLLKTTLSKITAEYRTKKGNHGAHLLYADLIDFVNLTADIFGEPDQQKFALNHESYKKFSQPFNLRLAVMLFVLKATENEKYLYQWTWVQPSGGRVTKGSLLYRSGCEVLMINNSSDLDLNEQHRYLKCLQKYLDFDPEILKGIENHLEKFALDEKIFKKVKQSIEKINQDLNAQLNWVSFEMKQKPGFAARRGANTQCLLNYGINSAVSKVSTYLIPEASKQFTKTALGAIGFMVFGPTGACLGVIIGEHLAGSLLPSTVGQMCVSAVNPVSNVISVTAGGLVTVALYPIEKGVTYAFSSDPLLKKKQLEYISKNQEFIDALQKLPPQQMSDYRKEVLRGFRQ